MKSLSLGVGLIIVVSVWGGEAKPDEPGRAAPSANPVPAQEPGQIRDDNGLKMKLAWCPPGKFLMGHPEPETGRRFGNAPVEVSLTKGFWIGKFEVTQAEWERVMNTTPWQGREHVREGAKYPATFISMLDAASFAEELTRQEQRAGRLPEGYQFALPTEAQWEYACRSGSRSMTRYSFGDDRSLLSEYSWWDGKYDNGNTKDEPYPHQVGLKKPNPWGLHDLHGNAWEWCQDGYMDLRGGTDPEQQANPKCKVIRGGGWGSVAEICETSHRDGTASDHRSANIGFRIALRVVP